jgi:hypothetical protein
MQYRERVFMQDDDERTLRFHVLYSALLNQSLDRDEFAADDLYAFQALERAMRCDNQELRNVAAHLQARRQAMMEAITLRSKETLNATRPLVALSAQSMRAAFAAAPVMSGATRQLPQQPGLPHGERRRGAHPPSPQERTRLTYLERLYRLEFGRPFHVTRFAVDDGYGRVVLKEALAAANQELVTLARHYVDEHGRPRQHRRGEQAMAQ